MRILFLSDNFPPEYNAPATRTFEHCREWVRHGAEVTVVTCVPNFPQGKIYKGYRNKLHQTEQIEGIKVIRVWSFISKNEGTFKRTIDFLSFAVSSFLAGIWVKCDVIVATSPQFFTAVSGWALSFIKRKKWVMEVRDIWPESIRAVNAVKSARVIAFLERVELFLYRSTFKVIVVTDSFKQNLISRGIDESKVVVVKNGVDMSTYQPPSQDHRNTNPRPSAICKVGYIGTHGLAHSLDFIVRSIAELNDTSFEFTFVGDGAEKRNIVRLAHSLGLNNVQFLDPVPKEEIGRYLSELDIAIVPLRKSPTFESVIPSKIFETVAMEVPILLGVDGETRRIIEHYGAGIFFEPENTKDFIKKLKTLRDQIAVDRRSIIEGCRKMAEEFDRKNLALEMLRHLHAGAHK